MMHVALAAYQTTQYRFFLLLYAHHHRVTRRATISGQPRQRFGTSELSNGYSGSDVYGLCAEAALGSVTDIGEPISSVDVASVRPVSLQDFEHAARIVRAPVTGEHLDDHVKWNESFGSFPIENPCEGVPVEEKSTSNTLTSLKCRE